MTMANVVVQNAPFTSGFPGDAEPVLAMGYLGRFVGSNVTFQNTPPPNKPRRRVLGEGLGPACWLRVLGERSGPPVVPDRPSLLGLLSLNTHGCHYKGKECSTC